MSYTINSVCWNCVKKEKCTDHKHIQTAVNEIHKAPYSDEQGHMGSGNIMHQCFRFVAKD